MSSRDAHLSEKYSEYAVQINYNGQKLGYIPRSENKHISRMLQAGIPLKCEVLATDPEKMAWYAVIAAVYINKNSL